jgi:hypothetical protein
MSKFDKKMQALKLRRKGTSIKTIAEKLDISKGTASVWCRDIVLTKKQEQKLKRGMIAAGHKGRMLGAEMNRRKKADAIAFYRESGTKEIGNFEKRDFLMAGLGLYWGEGSKTDRGNLSFTNSDPDAIVFMYKWFRDVLEVKREDFIPRIFINEIHRPRIKNVIQFWLGLLPLPKEQFRKTVFIKTKQQKIYENHNSYFGIISLRIKKSTSVRYRIMGLLEAIKKPR